MYYDPENPSRISRIRKFIHRNFSPIPKAVKLATISVYKGDFVELDNDKVSPLIVRDCLGYVFSFLNAKDLVKIQTVNKTW